VSSSDSYRDRLGLVTEEGARSWIYPKQPSGRYYTARTILSFLLLAVLFGTPLIKIDGHPFMMFNVVEGQFILFGAGFGTHDFFILGLLTISFIVFILLFTVVFGRLFCGWVCPQTVFMEMVFRKIEYWLEGDFREQQRLNAAPWTAGKAARKLTKYGIFFAIAFLIGNTLLAWIIGVDQLWKIVTDPPAEHVAGLTAMFVFSGIFYWIFAWFREQACILVCPYGRLQGVLLDKDSIVIAYDRVRGEPRGKLTKGEERTKGDCIDCGLCVDVCPTGIDIRNGTQLECVNCTACIDACDPVMDKIGKPRGLIRYDSENNIVNKVRKIWTPRVVGYTAVLTVLVGLLTYLLTTRSLFDATILRSPGMFFQEQTDGRVSNIYDVKVTNKTFEAATVSIRVESDPNAEVRFIGGDLAVGPQQAIQGKAMILRDRASITKMSMPLQIGVYVGNERVAGTGTTFLGPTIGSK
jgi:cytochrome c oxidase accessory protein FixG